MTTDVAHSLACLALGADDRISRLLEIHGDSLYSSLLPPSADTGGKWIELVLLGTGNADYIDDPAGTSVVLARCIVDPVSGECQVVMESSPTE